MEPILLVVVVILVVLVLLAQAVRRLPELIVNGIVGVVLLFVTNTILADDLPINLLTVLICAIGGVVGWLAILVLHVLGIAF
ncbi:MAG: pro-sigmaK processing inhibitor BofA family protein [Actinomycetota bacterium]|nr:pro-sigmaK processing inhibitor BofA family protein [Actinomycetota bacterium]